MGYTNTPFYFFPYIYKVDNMAKKDQTRIPTGMAGIVRYSEEPKEMIKIKPEYVIYFTIALIVLEVFLKFYA